MKWAGLATAAALVAGFGGAAGAPAAFRAPARHRRHGSFTKCGPGRRHQQGKPSRVSKAGRALARQAWAA